MGLNSYKQENARLKERVLEQEKKIYELNQQLSKREQQLNKYIGREQSIASAIEFAVERSDQLESASRKLYELDIQRSRLLYLSLENALKNLYQQYPQLKRGELNRVRDNFKNALYGDDNQERKYIKPPFKSDVAVRKLLKNIVNYLDCKRESVVLKRRDALPENMNFTTESYLYSPSNSGFDINEALHPTEQLEDILKSFDLDK